MHEFIPGKNQSVSHVKSVFLRILKVLTQFFSIFHNHMTPKMCPLLLLGAELLYNSLCNSVIPV